MKTLQMKDWTGNFSDLTKDKPLPVPVSKEIYWHFLEALPAAESGKTRKAFKQPTDQYFLVGEPSSHAQGLPVFSCFAQRGDEYFYMGELHRKSMLECTLDKDEENMRGLEKAAKSGEIISLTSL